MKFEMTRVLHEDKIIFSGEVSGYDLMTLNLDAFDRRLLEECEASNDVADKILALEMLFRRHAEAKARRGPNV